MRIEAGTRIRFTRRIVESADGDHPEFLLCDRGECGFVVGFGKCFPYSVATDSWPSATFGATAEDFEVIEATKATGGE